MGFSPSSASDWADTTRSYSGKSASTIYTSNKVDEKLDTKAITVRESRDSDASPATTPIILISDNTGSMGNLAAQIIQHDLGVMLVDIFDKKPVTDPQILVGAVGDTYYDRVPLQVTQFESEAPVLTGQLEKLYIERGGGGNDGESYILAWYFAANKTAIDSMVKRGKKGFLFTIGDEPPLLNIPKDHLQKVFGPGQYEDQKADELFNLVSQSYEVYHVIVKPVGGAHDKWLKLIGQRAILVSDPHDIGAVISSTMRVVAGEAAEAVASSWSGSTSMVVRDAIKDIVPAAGSDIVAL